MSESSSPLGALGSRIAGLLADLVLLGVFLLFGVTCLNVLIQVIVLIVGTIVHFQTPMELRPEEVRIGTDAIDLLIAVGLAVVGYFFLRGVTLLRRSLLHLFVDAGFASFVSKRYLLGRQGGRLVSLISVISILGVATGVMALIVVISVMQGFDDVLVSKFMGVYSHAEIRPRGFSGDDLLSPQIYRALTERLEEMDEVVAAAPVINHQTIVQRNLGAGEYKAPVLIRGIDPESEGKITKFIDYVKAGSSNPGDREVVIGAQLARKLALRPGDSIYAIGKIIATANRTAAKTTQLKVVGIFDSGLFEADDKFMFTNLKTAQSLMVIGDQVQYVHVRLKDPENVDEFRYAINERFGGSFYARTWQDLNPEFFHALMIEKIAMAIILLLIVVVASFNIIGTLIMMVVQKTREIGILKSMGATRLSISSIFLLNGFLIGVIGTSLGTVWGLRLCQFVANDIEKIFKMPGAVYGLDRLPVVINPWIIGSIILCTFLICILASIIPAAQAARLNPVEALRYD